MHHEETGVRSSGSGPRRPAAPGLDGKAIGERVRALRLDRSLTLRGLAARLGISPSALSQIERGRRRPSVMRLYQILTELGAPASAVFGGADPAPVGAPAAGPPGTAPAVVARRDDAAVVELAHGVRYRRLSPAPLAKAGLYECVYPPGAYSGPDAEFLTHTGHETGSVTRGVLTVEIGGEQYALGPGDAIAFRSERPHRIANLGAVDAAAVWLNLDDGSP